MSDLIPTLKGDVDILAGPLRAKNPNDFHAAVARFSKEVPTAHPTSLDHLAALEIAETGGIEWPPKTDYLVGIEAKCLRLDPNAKEISGNTVKSRKSSPQAIRKIRQKVERLVQMGFDRVALLEFIANPPAGGVGSRPWTVASNIAFDSEKAVASVFENRLSADTVAGHWVCSIGSIIGADETLRGCGGATEYRAAQENDRSQDRQKAARRREMEFNLRSILEVLPAPRSFPALFINCKPCHKLHRSYFDDPCNAAYKADRHGIETLTL